VEAIRLARSRHGTGYRIHRKIRGAERYKQSVDGGAARALSSRLERRESTIGQQRNKLKFRDAVLRERQAIKDALRFGFGGAFHLHDGAFHAAAAAPYGAENALCIEGANTLGLRVKQFSDFFFRELLHFSSNQG